MKNALKKFWNSKLFTWGWFKTDEGKNRYKCMYIGYCIGIALTIIIIKHYIPDKKEVEEMNKMKNSEDIEDKQ